MQQKTNRVPDNEVIGAGVVYGNYGLTNQFKMGATKGGNSFNMNISYSSEMSDSDFIANTKGAIDIDTIDPVLTINSLNWDKQGYTYFAGMAAQSISGGQVKIYQGADVAYPLSNIAIVTENRAGYAKAYVLEDPIVLNGMQFDAQRVGEIVRPMEFHATADPTTFDASDPTTFPMYVIEEASALTITVYDDAGTPAIVEGALVVLGDGQSGTSAAVTGIVPAITVNKGEVYYTVSKSGHTTTSGYITVDEDAESATITLPITP